MAVKERKPEDMMQVTSVRSWLLLGSIIVILASVIVWSVTTQLPERIEGKGVLQTEAGTQQITAAGEGIVHELKLQPGAAVRGDGVEPDAEHRSTVLGNRQYDRQKDQKNHEPSVHSLAWVPLWRS